jgi:hypothetical protein
MISVRSSPSAINGTPSSARKINSVGAGRSGAVGVAFGGVMSKFRPHQGPSLSDAISAINHFVEHARNPNVRIRFMNINRQVLLKNTVSAVPVETDFQLVEAAMPEAGEGQVRRRPAG